MKGNLRESREKLNHIYRDIDDAFRRRFEKRVLIGLPSLIARKNLLDLNLKNVSLDDSVDLEEIAKLLKLKEPHIFTKETLPKTTEKYFFA